MWKYIVKRLLVALPTLLGITVLTFCLLRLAPGDPAGIFESDGTTAQGMNLERMRQTRKIFGLDKPLLLNFDVKDRRRTVLSAFNTLVGEKEPALKELYGHELRALGKRLIPYLAPLALESEKEASSEALAALAEGAGVKEARTREALASWWTREGPSFKPDAVDELLARYESAPADEAALLADAIAAKYGELALPRIMERIDRSLEGTGARRRLIRLAAPWAGYRQPLGPDAGRERYETALAFIRLWWEREGLSFREIDAWERVLKTFTEAQYPIWLGRILTLDFGESTIDYQPVIRKVYEAFKVTFGFQVIVLTLIYLLAVPMGILSAARHGSLVDRAGTVLLFMLYSLPNFWVAYMLLFLLGGGGLIEIFPLQGLNSMGAESLSLGAWMLDRLWHMCLPVLCMTYGGLAVVSRYARTGMLEELGKDYILLARAKGLSEGAVILKHALRNGMVPIITLAGGLVPGLISGSVIIETIFGIPGMGRLGYTAVLQRDYPVVMAIAFFSSLLVLLGILLSDIVHALADPRIDFEGGGTA